MKQNLGQFALFVAFGLAFLVASAYAGDRDQSPSVSATIQATATVISPFGIAESSAGNDSFTSTPDNDWLLRLSRPGDIVIQVEADGQSVDVINSCDCTDIVRQRHLDLADNPCFSLLDHDMILAQVPANTDACQITIIRTDD
jgi:hypothetical protein